MAPTSTDSNALSVTVVVPAFNEEANIAPLVTQILDEPWADTLTLDELIVVDDCSSDKTQSITERLAREHANVRVIRHDERGGKNAGMRTGLAACRSDVVVFVDADVRLGAECITKTTYLLASDPSIAMSSCIIEPLPPRSWRERAAHAQALLVGEFKRSGIGYLSAIYAIRMSAITGMHLPDTTADDAYVMGWLRYRGYRVTVRPDATAYIRASSGLRDFAKQTLRGRRGEMMAKQAWHTTTIIPNKRFAIARSIARTIVRDPVGCILYTLWYGLIKVTPTRLWLPIVDVSRYDTSTSTKSLDG